MPLKVGGDVIGVISVESRMPDAFTEQDERLLATLASRAARSAAGSCTFELPILNRELAELIGIRPETLSRAIAQLRTLGLAQLDGRTVHVPSLANLSRIAGCHGDSYQPQPMAA